MKTMPIEEAKNDLDAVLAQLEIGEGIYLMRDDRIVAYLQCAGKPNQGPRQFGGQKGSIFYMAPDFNAPMELIDSKELQDLKDELQNLKALMDSKHEAAT